jgi:alkyl hydroperoxide reductase subunit AhpF
LVGCVVILAVVAVVAGLVSVVASKTGEVMFIADGVFKFETAEQLEISNAADKNRAANIFFILNPLIKIWL